MRAKIFVDTSGWLAYILAGEAQHSAVKAIISRFIKEGKTLCTSNDIIDETVTRLVYATNPAIVKRFITLVEKSIASKSLVQLWVDEQTQQEGLRIVSKYADQKLSLTDATTMVLYKRFGMEGIVTLDSDFSHFGYTTLP